MRRLAIACALCLSAAGCSSDIAQWNAVGAEHKVTVYSGGVAARTFTSVGKVQTEVESDGWFFMDKSSRKLVRVSGTVVIEAL